MTNAATAKAKAATNAAKFFMVAPKPKKPADATDANAAGATKKARTK